MKEHLSTTNNPDLERLLALGFDEVEASRLLHMKNHVDEQVEYREMQEESRRLSFIRWLIEHDRISR